MVNPPDALLTVREQAATREVPGLLLDANALCAAQHAKTLRWVADWLTHRSLVATADELRALADGRGEG